MGCHWLHSDPPPRTFLATLLQDRRVTNLQLLHQLRITPQARPVLPQKEQEAEMVTEVPGPLTTVAGQATAFLPPGSQLSNSQC